MNHVLSANLTAQEQGDTSTDSDFSTRVGNYVSYGLLSYCRSSS